jgi:endonuclease V-like protein UPF0215 family
MTALRWPRRLSNVIGFDDAPFARAHRGPVALVGTVCSGTRLDIVVRGEVTRDGDDATAVMAHLVRSKSLVHVRAVMLQGLTTAGFNVIDLHALHAMLEMPVLVVMRHFPDFDSFFHALARVPGAEAKRALVEQAGTPEKVGPLFVQRAGLTLDEAHRMLENTTSHGVIPEPLRLAHLIAGGMTTGKSRGRA